MLTDQQIDFLKTRLGKFRKADFTGKRDIIMEHMETLEKSWCQEYGASLESQWKMYVYPQVHWMILTHF